MLIFSPFLIQLPFNTMGVYTFNISSYSESAPRLNALTPNRIDISDPGFYYENYKNYILNNHDAFMQMMDIVYKLYNGSDVILLIGPDDMFRTIFKESVAKFIQDRYGYISNFVSDPDDLIFIVEGDFSVEGLHNLDIDKEIYIKEVFKNA